MKFPAMNVLRLVQGEGLDPGVDGDRGGEREKFVAIFAAEIGNAADDPFFP